MWNKKIIADFYPFKSVKSVASVFYLFLILFSTASFAQIKFDDYFFDKTLRLDYYHTGNHEEDFYSFDELIEEPFWAGSKVNLIDKFNFGNYKFVVIDEKSGKPIYSRTYSTLFAEWQTVDEAKETYKSFSETVVFPFPKNNVVVEFYGRDRQNNLVKKFEYKIDSSNYFIKKERPMKYETMKVLYNGDPANKVDVAFIPEGYTRKKWRDSKKIAKSLQYIFLMLPHSKKIKIILIFGQF